MKTSKYLSICAILAAGAFMGSCNEDMETFDNKISVDGASSVTTLLLDGSADAATYTLQAQIPQPAAQEVTITYAVDPSLVDMYNEVYHMNAIMLPEEYYSIPDPVAIINADGIKSSTVAVEIKNLGEIDEDYIYCLPVTVASSSIPVLASKKTKFFVVRGASLVNWVTNLTENFLSLANPSQATNLANMSQITVEALVRPGSDFGDGNDSGISTWIGIEGSRLLRFGDAGVPPLQLQFANSSNVTSSQWTIEKEKWQFLTFTYDASTGVCQFYIDGVQKGGDISSTNRGSVSWNSSQTFIGKSYSNNRDFQGDMAEVRVWNRILSKEEINSKNHFYKVDPESDGLVAYWKMDEGDGNRIHDYANGYDMTANATLTWLPVALP
jgi:hypothetical protein